MLCFFISTLFSRANIAAAAGGVIFFCFYLPYSFLVVWEESLSSDFKIISVSDARICSLSLFSVEFHLKHTTLIFGITSAYSL